MKQEHSSLIMGLGLGLVLSLILGSFFLGALVGPRLFAPDSEAKLASAPPVAAQKVKKKYPKRRLSRLTDHWDEPETDPFDAEEDWEEESLEEGAPHYQVDEEGEASLVEEAPPQERPIDPNTFVRFKASGHSRFAVQVHEHFDEMVASAQIQELKQQGVDAYLAIQNPGSRDQSYAVRVGTFTDRQVAEDSAAVLSNRLQKDLRVVAVD